MSEADWWLCPRCSSLNSLSARRCYSCRTRKERQAQRLSDIESFEVVEMWDGKVKYLPRAAATELPRTDRPASPPPPPPPSPIRWPASRHITVVAPRPPFGARIEYRQPPAQATRVTPPVARSPLPRQAPIGAPPPTPSGAPLQHDRAGGATVPAQAERPNPQPLEAGALEIQHTGPWPHWAELLAGPGNRVPGGDLEAGRGGSEYDPAARIPHVTVRSLFESHREHLTLGSALNSARMKRSRPLAFVNDWPEADAAAERPAAEGISD